MKNLENGQEIMFGPAVSEIPPNPPLEKGGEGGISGRALVLGKILASGCGYAHLRTIFEKR